MPLVPFSNLPESARLWVYGAAQPVAGDEAVHLLTLVQAFIEEWHAHGEPVVAGCDWMYDHFLLVGADEEATGVSGCSIDSLFRTLRRIEGEMGVTLLDSSLVFYRDTEGEVLAVPRGEFRALVEAGEISNRTRVFDNTVGTVAALHNGEWERPFAGSWQERAFRRRTSSAH